MPRRRNLFKRGHVWYYRKLVNGRNRVRSLHTGDETIARRKARALEAERDLLLADRRATVAALSKKWLATSVARTRRNARDQRTVAQRVRDYFDPFLGMKPVGAVTRRDLQEYAAWLQARGTLKLQTVAHVLADARCFFNWAVEAEYLTASPFPRKLMPRIEEKAPDRLSDDELERVLRIPEPWAFVVRLGLGTGLRWGEMVAVRSTDLQKAPDGCWQLLVPRSKSRRPRRVPLSPDLATELRRHVGMLVGRSARSSGSFNNAVRRKSGVERFHVHQLRHTFGCRYMEAGGELLALKEILGHADIQTTLRYSALADEVVRRDAALVHQRLANGLDGSARRKVVAGS